MMEISVKADNSENPQKYAGCLEVARTATGEHPREFGTGDCITTLTLESFYISCVDTHSCIRLAEWV